MCVVTHQMSPPPLLYPSCPWLWHWGSSSSSSWHKLPHLSISERGWSKEPLQLTAQRRKWCVSPRSSSASCSRPSSKTSWRWPLTLPPWTSNLTAVSLLLQLWPLVITEHRSVLILGLAIHCNLGFSLTESKHDLSLNISTNGAASISVSVEVNGTVYSGELWSLWIKCIFFGTWH